MACGNQSDSVLGCLLPKVTSLTEEHLSFCLVKSLTKGNIPIAEWLDKMFHLMDHVNRVLPSPLSLRSAVRIHDICVVQWFLARAITFHITNASVAARDILSYTGQAVGTWKMLLQVLKTAPEMDQSFVLHHLFWIVVKSPLHLHITAVAFCITHQALLMSFKPNAGSSSKSKKTKMENRTAAYVLSMVVEDDQTAFVETSAFYVKRVPDISLKQLLMRWTEHWGVPQEALPLACLYIERLRATSSAMTHSKTTFLLTRHTVHKCLVACVCVATKVLVDDFGRHSAIAMSCGIRPRTLTLLEMEVMQLLDYNLFVDEQEFWAMRSRILQESSQPLPVCLISSATW
ncbi:hypothetical protein Pelo_4595 [Pelomyxa schiedti]|nr:hypothetical protein Pelo_4595 [Pelomyxa schiedti]